MGFDANEGEILCKNDLLVMFVYSSWDTARWNVVLQNVFVWKQKGVNVLTTQSFQAESYPVYSDNIYLYIDP